MFGLIFIASDVNTINSNLEWTPKYVYFCFLVFMTANFKYEGTENMEKLLEYQPNRPILVSEFWPGWFDHW